MMDRIKEVDEVNGYRVGDRVHIVRYLGNSKVVDVKSIINKITINEETGRDTLWCNGCSTSSSDDDANKGHVITEEEYQKAKRIVDLYDRIQRVNRASKLFKMKEELRDYFEDNIVGGFKIKDVDYQVHERYINIIPKDPYIEEWYHDPKADQDIKEIGEKYGENVRWVYYVYGK